MMAAHDEPSAAVHAGTPVAEAGDHALRVAVIEVARRVIEFLDRKRCVGIVIESEIDVRIGPRGAARMRAAERDRRDTVDRAEPRHYPIAQILNPDGKSVHTPAPN